MNDQLPTLILHGHFYQPPREDPWINEIMEQQSALPYHDWNERIAEECYSPNSESRILDEQGRILEIINNYEYMNFNFGPTLLSWIEKYTPLTYERILEADRVSTLRNRGHGNAIAQVYNHMIMPLCTERDVDTQLIWGIEDFRRRFNRYPEGMWLAETAINPYIAQRLASFGIKYVILSPEQAYHVYDSETLKVRKVSDGSIDPTVPYTMHTPGGVLTCFFYNKSISTSISFEHILTDAKHLRHKLLEQANVQKRLGNLVFAATDGESYGHHEPFGDMCLAYFFHENNINPVFNITNLGNYLEDCKPWMEVELKPGIGSSWSCSHGVGRWMEDCGCSTGGKPGWNQKWRTPLRNAFDYLRDQFSKIFEREANPFLNNCWETRNHFIRIIQSNNDPSQIYAFFKEHAKIEISDEIVQDLLMLLHAQKYAMYMYTSCGWFFNDISGIETVQDIRYAQRAIELMEPFFNEQEEHIPHQFRTICKEGKSNIPEFYDGEWIYQNFVTKYRITTAQNVYQYIISNIVTYIKNSKTPHLDIDKGSLFELAFMNLNVHSTAVDSVICYVGSVHAIDTVLTRKNYYSFIVVESDNKFLVGYLRLDLKPLTTEELESVIFKEPQFRLERRLQEWSQYRFTLNDIPNEFLKPIFFKLHQEEWDSIRCPVSYIKAFSETQDEAMMRSNILTQRYNAGVRIIRHHKMYHLPFDDEQFVYLNALFNSMLRELMDKNLQWGETIFRWIEAYLSMSHQQQGKINSRLLYHLFNEELNDILIQLELEDFLSIKLLRNFELYLDFANYSQIQYNRRKVESKVFNVLVSKMESSFFMNPENKHLMDSYLSLLRVAQKLNINVNRFLPEGFML